MKYRVYLASPKTDGAALWRAEMTMLLERAGLSVYDPWENRDAPEVDLDAIRRSDALVAYLPDDGLVVGVFIEIGIAMERRTPVIATCTAEKYLERTMLAQWTVFQPNAAETAERTCLVLGARP